MNMMVASVFLLVLLVTRITSFSPPNFPLRSSSSSSSSIRLSSEKSTNSFDETDRASKGLVSSLTNFVNAFFPKQEELDDSELPPAPTSPQELLQRIQADYTERNYLWTGDIDLLCFDKDCKFTDPTISFVGRSTFVQNTQNLKFLVERLTTDINDTQSKLLSIENVVSAESQYIESRWNMVGSLSRLPWAPRIDVVGRTKFWYETQDDGSLQVVFYDECWEIPAAQALGQLVSPGPQQSVAE